MIYLRPSARGHLRPSALSAFCVLFATTFIPLTTQAEVKASNAWVRATVAAQKSTGAFLTLTSSEDAKVVAASSPAAAAVEIHSSAMHNGVMQMHAVEKLDLPAGKAVELKPGGYHVMLLGLAKPVAVGDKVPLVFTIEDKGGKRTTLEVAAQARPLSSR